MVQVDAEVQKAVDKAVKNWSETLLSREDLVGYIEKTLEHSVFPKLLSDMAASMVSQALMSSGAVNAAVKQWASRLDIAASLPAGDIPREIKERIAAAVERIDEYTYAEDLKDKQVAAFRMWSSGSSVKVVAEKLGITEIGVKRLLKRAKTRVQNLRDQLAIYE